MEQNRDYRGEHKEKKPHTTKDTQFPTEVAKIHIRERLASSTNGAGRTL